MNPSARVAATCVGLLLGFLMDTAAAFNTHGRSGAIPALSSATTWVKAAEIEFGMDTTPHADE